MFSLNGSFSGFQVSRLGFGSAGLSGVYNTPHSHEYGCSVIKEVFDRGITLFDTSDLYGDNHDNEIMLGKVLFYFYFEL
jgi:aryl-alcohol dehydrogenase-like predicted oxidoreductase